MLECQVRAILVDKQFVLRAFPDGSGDRFVAKALIAVAVLIALLGVWAAIAKVPEVAKTRGEVIPQGGDIHSIQSLSGGKILQVLVTEGDVVKKGQVLANLDNSISEADIRKLDVQHASILMRMERLRALEKNREPRFGAEGENFPGVAREEMELFKSQADLMASKLKVIDGEISSRQADLTSVRQQLVYLDEQVATTNQELEMFEAAVDKGVTSTRDLLLKKESLSALMKDREALVGRRDVLTEEIGKLTDQRSAEEHDLHTQYRTERSDLVEQLREVEEELIQLHAALGQNALVAPQDGIIKALPNAKPGSVVQPGGVIAELVPSNHPLHVEVKVSPRDIGFIRVGQPVLVKVDAYDYSRFGAIEGEVDRVSPSTFKDERTGQAYFKATIKTFDEFVGEPSMGRRIKVGMTVEADITTGHKTVFEYLLKPVYTTVDTALTER